MIKWAVFMGDAMLKRKKLLIFVSILLLLVAAAGVLIHNANRILKYELQQFLGKDFSVEDISIRWGQVEARGIAIRGQGQEKNFSAERLELNASFMGLLKKENMISGVKVHSPFLLLVTDRKGNIILPLQERVSAKKTGNEEKTAKPFLINSFSVSNGSIDYRDMKVSSPPALIKLRGIDAEIKELAIPVNDRMSEYSVSASVPSSAGKGTVKADGTINLKTKETKSRLNIRNLDIVQLRPYYEKKGDVEVTKGYLSLDADINIVKEKIRSSGKIILKDLEFRSSSGSFLGLPLIAVIKLLKDGNDQISLEFEIEGDLNNPRFSIRDSIVQKLSLSLAKTLGMPIEAIGKSIFDVGGSALKSIFGK